MNEQHVTILIRLSFAAVAAAAVVLAPVTWAQEPGDNTIDLKNLVFFKGDAYSITYEDSVSTTATASIRVRKIGYGETSIVNIVTTASGIYSSDAMVSPHVLYPGVHVEKLPDAVDDGEGGGDYPPRLARWTSRGWIATPYVKADSFAIVSRSPSGAIVVNGTHGNCVLTKTIARC